MFFNGKAPSLNQIRYFVTVAKHLNFRRAAQILGISQPTLTSQISTLETNLGLVLFERSRSGTLLSAQGKALLEYADAVLQSTMQFGEMAQSLSQGDSTTYRLGIPPTLGPYLLPHILPDIHRQRPGLKFYVREAAPKQLLQGLLAGEFDITLSPMSNRDSQIQTQPLFIEPLKFVLPADHPMSGRDFIEPEEIRGQKILALEDRHHFHYQVHEICTELGANVDRDYEGTSLDTLRQMVVMGMGSALLPALYVRSEIHRPEELTVRQFADRQLYREHYLLYRRMAPSRNFYRQLGGLIRDVVQAKLADTVIPIA